jgi:hypothetical protein
MNDLILSKLKVGQLDGNGACIASGFRRPTDTSALTADGGSTITLSVAQSGTLFEVEQLLLFCQVLVFLFFMHTLFLLVMLVLVQKRMMLQETL